MFNQLVKQVNEAVNKQLPAINNLFSRVIKAQGLDPLEHLYAGHFKLGKIGKGIADVGIDYSAGHFTGLSSISIAKLNLDLENAGAGEQPSGGVFGHLSIHASAAIEFAFSAPLQIDVSGAIFGEVLVFHKKQNFSGTAILQGVDMKASGMATIGLDPAKAGIELEDIHLSDMSGSYQQFHLELKDLGPFQPFATLISSSIEKLVQEKIAAISKDSLRNVLNKALEAMEHKAAVLL